jgi:sterol desaturase/sphingolipid hydroxylase (fatty acid hydroxylase superfamily)
MFLLFMGIEYYVAKKKGKHYFRFGHSVANLNVGIAERLLDVFTTGVFFYVFDYIHQHFALFSVKPNVATWALLFLLTDLVWYWYHRLAHEVNLFWSAHVVHHQSEDFNYTVSARITVFQAIVRSGFWCVLPLVGFPASMISILLLVHGLYPFFIHTRTIGKLGWLEYIFVTPSHHRVHHASNPEYLDKNYGDVLIIWDKLFGTFIEEKEEPLYGLTKPVKGHSFLWQHFHFMLELLLAAWVKPGFTNKIKLLFGPPDLISPVFRENIEEKFLNVNKEVKHNRTLKVYVGIQTTLSIGLLFILSLWESFIPVWLQTALALFILVSLINCGAMLDQRRWVFYLEYIRLLIVLAILLVILPDHTYIAALLILTGVLTYFISPIQERYLRLMYGPV